MNPLHPIAQRVLAAHLEQHGQAATVLARAPGRVNLIGEHTDYNDGFVLPAAIDRNTWVAASPRSDGLVQATALDWQAEQDRFDPRDPAHAGGWRDHVRGTLAQVEPCGLNLTIAGDVPQGAGLSSSASLALALLRAHQAVRGGEREPWQLARLAQQAENRFVGTQCGIMDQLASACGQAEHALLIDCRSLGCEAVPLPPGTALFIAHSRVRRGLVDSAYNERRRQCEQAAQVLGVPALRDATLPALLAAREQMPETVLRRARHIVTENERVLHARQALATGDLRWLGRLMAASHDSMRDDFEITHPAVDRLAELLQAVAGTEGGARMTGGGFGGCVVALLPEQRVDEARARLAADYRSPEGEPATVFVCRPAEGAAAWPLQSPGTA